MLQPRILPCLRTATSLTLRNIFRRSYATVEHTPAVPSEPLIPQAHSSEAASTSTPSISNVRSKSQIILRTYKPRTPGVRHLRRPINDHLWKGKPVRALTFVKVGHGKGGRNRLGKVCVRHRGGGHRRRVRQVDTMRLEGGKQTVVRIEYDPNRSAHLALLQHSVTKKLSYVIAAEGLREGDTVESFRKGLPEELIKSMGGTVDPGMLAVKTAVRGNCLPLHLVPLGTQVFCVGSSKARGGVFCRSAGTHAIVVSKDEGENPKHVVVRLQSGETRKCAREACATIGIASNPLHQFRQLGKAGRSRWLNIRPAVRGLAMNACDHPHGGGRGKSKGNRQPVSPWGTPAKGGYKTRKKRNKNVWVVHERFRNQGRRRTGHIVSTS